MPSLFTTVSDIQELEHILDQEETIEGSHEAIAEFLLEPKEELLAEKIDSYVIYVRDLEATVKAQETEAKHLRNIAKANKNKIKRLKEAAQWASEMLGRKKLKGNTRTITVSESNRPAIDILDVRDIPADFKEQVFEWKVDKKSIVEHLMETGEVVSGVEARKVTRVMMR